MSLLFYIVGQIIKVSAKQRLVRAFRVNLNRNQSQTTVTTLAMAEKLA